ncbi:MAG: Holliday junction resolvase RuvX [Helicobacteraceae bacterium]|jgi:putative Holliday junction resolvase|nr:Holliday junction resolvase RuvX [Helicobacteraceae bacterium]
MAYLSVDMGLKRIGLAYSPDGKTAVAIAPIIRKNRVQASGDLRRIIAEKKIDRLVVGLPIGYKSEEDMKRRIDHFLKLLNTDIPVHFQDETDSSKEAAEFIKDKKDGRIDSIAALIILERFLRSEKSTMA